MHFISSHNIFIFLVQLFIILSSTKLVVFLFRKSKQPAITFELIIGLILGPTILGKYFPALHKLLFPVDLIQMNMLETVSWIGVLFLLLDVGLEIDFSVAWRQRGDALKISIADIIIPMIVAFIPCYFFISDIFIVDPSRRFIFSLFLSVVMTISAMPVAARILHDLNLLKTEMGYLTMSALAINDITGWVLFSIILGIFSQTSVDFFNIAIVLMTTIGFVVFAFTYGRKFSNKIVDSFKRKGYPEPATSFSFMCLIGLLFGAITEYIGIHALFGFFIAGIVVGEAKSLNENSRNIINQMVHAFFIPVFFVNIGLKLDFIADFNIYLVLLITIIGISGRYLGAWVGVSITKVPKVNRDLISIAHTPGGMMEILVAYIAFESGLITSPIFIAIVCGAIFSSIIMGPWMRRSLMRKKSVRIFDFFNIDRIIHTIQATQRDKAINEISQKLTEILKPEQIEEILEEVKLRESNFGTGIGYGVAIPHARTELVQEPVLIFARSKNGIEWNAPDGKLVNFIFFLISPKSSGDVHVQVLSKIAKMMHSEDNRSDIELCEDNETILTVLKNILVEEHLE